MANEKAGKRHRTVRVAHRGRVGSARAVAAAGMATTVLAGSLGMAITSPQATAGVSRSVLLTAGDETPALPSLQQAIQMVLDATHNAVEHDAALPFATEASSEALPTILRNTNYELLIAGLSSQIPDLFFRYPEVVAGDAANPRQLFQFFTPDFHYQV
ncbi:MAG: hypothetical protein ACRDTN_06995, partial [Mycobacterium sp.]